MADNETIADNIEDALDAAGTAGAKSHRSGDTHTEWYSLTEMDKVARNRRLDQALAGKRRCRPIQFLDDV